MAKKAEDNLAAAATAQIIRLILDGELSPGEAISQRSVALRLEMSTQPVAQAFRQLELDGIVVSKKRSGTRIATLSPADAWDSIQVRLAVEEKAIDLTCANAKDEEIEVLSELALEADRIYDDRVMLDYDDRFHLTLCGASKSPGLTGALAKQLLLSRVKQQLCPGISFLIRLRHPSGTPGGYAPQRGHETLLNLIKMRESAEARQMLRTHVRLNDIAAMMENYSSHSANSTPVNF